MEEPKVSIIIPIYNLEAYMSNSIDSVLNQSHKNIEIYLIDDGSTDGSSELCDTYAERYSNIKVIHKKNAGVSAARNTGLDNATGDFIMFLDGDDIIAPNAIEVLLHDYENTPDCAYAGFSYVRINRYDHQFTRTTTKNKFISNDEVLYGLLGHGYENIGVWGKIYPAKKVNGIRFVEGKADNEDKFFLFQYLISNKGRISERDDRLYGYYVRPGSVTQSKYSEGILDRVYFSRRILCIVQKNRPKLIEAAEYNDLITRLSVLKTIVRSRMYKQEYQTFKRIKANLLKKYRNKKLSFFGKYKYEILTLRISNHLYILCVYLFDSIKRNKEES